MCPISLGISLTTQAIKLMPGGRVGGDNDLIPYVEEIDYIWIPKTMG